MKADSCLNRPTTKKFKWICEFCGFINLRHYDPAKEFKRFSNERCGSRKCKKYKTEPNYDRDTY